MSHNFEYSAKLKYDNNNTILVTFPDIPEAITFGDNVTDAIQKATDCLDTALAFRIKEGRSIPKPYKTKGDIKILPSTWLHNVPHNLAKQHANFGNIR